VARCRVHRAGGVARAGRRPAGREGRGRALRRRAGIPRLRQPRRQAGQALSRLDRAAAFLGVRQAAPRYIDPNDRSAFRLSRAFELMYREIEAKLKAAQPPKLGDPMTPRALESIRAIPYPADEPPPAPTPTPSPADPVAPTPVPAIPASPAAPAPLAPA